MSVASLKHRLNLTARGRRRVIAVIGSGRHADPCCAELGQLIAALGFDLLTGAGQGVMGAVSRAFFETSPRKGIVIGVVPALVTPLEALEHRTSSRVEYAPLAGYPNEWVELAIFTHLPDSGPDGTLGSSRNHINVLSADAIVALPGQEGTEAEAWLAVQYGVPVIAYGADGDGHAMAPHAIPLARSMSEIRAFLEAQ
jgi:predicted Rossmann-fold nucleotide-binding protein